MDIVHGASPRNWTMVLRATRASRRARIVARARLIDRRRDRAQVARIAFATDIRAALIEGRMPPISAIDSAQARLTHTRCGVTAIGKVTPLAMTTCPLKR